MLSIFKGQFQPLRNLFQLKQTISILQAWQANNKQVGTS